MISFEPHIVIQVNDKYEYQLMFEHFGAQGGVSSEIPGLPMCMRSNLDRSNIIGKQSNVLNAGYKFVDIYHTGISVAEFLGTSTEQPYEFW